MKKIAILTLVINNFGTKLQSYALCRTIKSFNLVEPEVINFNESWLGGSVKTDRKGQIKDVLKTYRLKSFKRFWDFLRYRYESWVIKNNKHTYEEAVRRQEKLYMEFDNSIPYSSDVLIAAD